MFTTNRQFIVQERLKFYAKKTSLFYNQYCTAFSVTLAVQLFLYTIIWLFQPPRKLESVSFIYPSFSFCSQFLYHFLWVCNAS